MPDPPRDSAPLSPADHAVIAFALGVTGIALLGMALQEHRNEAAWWARAHRVEGTLVGVRRCGEPKNGWEAVVAYTDHLGHDYRATRVPIGHRPAPVRIGERLSVLFDPQAPWTARLPSIGRRRSAEGAYGFFGALFLACALAVSRDGWKARRLQAGSTPAPNTLPP